MDFVEKKLKEWKMEEYLSNFENEGIDEESFFLLDDDTLKSLIPKAGPRLKFKKYLNSFIESSNFSALPTFDSPAPPCNSFSNSVTDSLTIFPHPVCNISDDSHANSDSANNESSIHDISLNYSDPLSSSTPLPLLSPLSTSSRKKINIRETVKLKLPYIFAKLEKGDPANVSILHKYRINRLLVQTYVEEYDCRPSTKNKLDLAKDIVNAFPVLKGSDGEGHEQWFSPGVRGAPATGFIADRFKNFRSRNLSVVEKEELGIGRISKKTNAKPEKYPGTEDSSVEFFQKQQWLKENESPLEKVIQLMQETFEGRRFEIMRNATNFVSNWPRILDPHVIEAEFKLLYGEQKSDSLCLEFGMTANLIIHQAKHCGRKCAEEFANSLNFDLNLIELSAEKICCALILLPLLLPQSVFRRNGPKKLKIRPTSSQSLDHFIQFIPVGEGVDKFMREDRLLGGERRQPFVLAIGEKCKPQQAFLIFEENCMEIKTVLKAVDLCFKLPELSLPQFNGDIETWFIFKEQFKEIIENCGLNDKQKLQYLQSGLIGIAKHVQTVDDTYDSLFLALEQRFENKRLIINKHINALLMLKYEKFRGDSNVELRNLVDTCTKHLRALKLLKFEHNTFSELLLIQLVMQVLDTETKRLFEMTLESTDIPKWDDFLAFLNKRCLFLENLPSAGTKDKQNFKDSPRHKASHCIQMQMLTKNVSFVL
ncbi:uncharacterized protein TNCT_416771 [Trichonephila clavata]|uniref:SAM domain-containing protein n=1 Tax=Trichonephila clavata TaxID=2740835 RepID=A0A8X6L5A2_TRICU|nr:uncharacterized protein TNCT_416771 [Trichonephila clavata]